MKLPLTYCFIGLFIAVLLNMPFSVSAEETKVDELKDKIETRNKEIEALNKEIQTYQDQIKEANKQKESLKNALYILNTNQKKLAAELKVTENKISSTDLKLEELSLEISEKERKLSMHERGLSESIKVLNEADSFSLLEILLSRVSLSQFWNNRNFIQSVQIGIKNRIAELTQLKSGLIINKLEVENVKAELSGLRHELKDRNTAVEYNKKETNSLLTKTQNKEQNYKDLLSEKLKLKEAFEKELFEFESQLKFEFDSSKIPDYGKPIFSWPVESPFITQYFGLTNDARRLYVSGTHNGIDLRAPTGTKIFSVLSGTVVASGNTDIVRGCYSYGKWVLVDHGNGLSTLYAHLSVISVNIGDELKTKGLIGYSGATGYATGPHLHLTVFASNGLTVQKYTQGKYCKEAIMPIAHKDAYIDPMSYLPIDI